MTHEERLAYFSNLSSEDRKFLVAERKEKREKGTWTLRFPFGIHITRTPKSEGHFILLRSGEYILNDFDHSALASNGSRIMTVRQGGFINGYIEAIEAIEAMKDFKLNFRYPKKDNK